MIEKNIQENLKLFYVGLENNKPFFYKNKDLTTHAAIIGMTGSGKTGLGISILEEACIDNIPSIIIDPKGDMTNLCLSFENLNRNDFLPYIDETEANNEKLSKEELSEKLSKRWGDGLNSSFQDISRIKLLKESVDFTIYTPKSNAGVSIALLGNFEAPNTDDDELLNSYISSITSSILSLLNVNVDETSKEHILISNIFTHKFSKNESINIQELILSMLNPPFNKIGVFSLEQFYPSDERMKLGLKLNTLISSNNFKAYTQGEDLDISKLLFNKDKKAKCNIFTISHLNDSERMFFVTILLNKIVTWMRSTNGTSSLRAILYMDEIFGFFPPNANPPSKQPMLLLLKQARAFGIGCILSTQNPVDLDYRGLSNIGTWFIGRLQTEQDKQKVISGLSGISDITNKELENTISNLEKRHFLIKNINESELRLIKTRWALSYLKGPLSKEHISTLMKDKKSKDKQSNDNFSHSKPLFSSNITQIFASNNDELSGNLLATADVKFYNQKLGIDTTKKLTFIIQLDKSDTSVNWDKAIKNKKIIQLQPSKNPKFKPIPDFILNIKNTNELKKDFKNFIYQNESLTILSALSITSKLDESKEEFCLRVQDICNEILEEKTQDIMDKFKKEESKLLQKLQKANYQLEKEENDLTSSKLDAIINIGTSIIGAFFGSKTKNPRTIASGVRKASKVIKEKNDVTMLQDLIDDINTKLDELSQTMQEEISNLKAQNDIKNIELKEIKIMPKKSDIFNEEISILWT
ncbi:ATP-binding protein [Campylobacter pinnipediorum]|uniref:ATP-binding protein n=1 Tax=Campylobacter pinnipediorum TaxID=1965231 RepID=UPI00084DC8F0|nr:DUF87 domain-containing protein [Campylobacter pinnipediorum]